MKNLPSKPPEPLFLTVGEFCILTHLSNATARRLCDAGVIASVRVSDRGDRRIPATEVERLLSSADANRSASVGGFRDDQRTEK